jgi:regulator of RNase E activity RraB
MQCFVVTVESLMGQFSCTRKTIVRMIHDGDLPPFTYGKTSSHKAGWHKDVLDKHALDKYTSTKNVSNTSEVRSENVAVMMLGSRNALMPKNSRHLDDRNPSKKKLGRKIMP